MQAKNRFGAGFDDDSDDEPVKQQTTKTQKKKEERKITDKAPRMINQKQAESGGFEYVAKDSQNKQASRGGGERGGRGGYGRGGRGGGDRGGRGGNRGRGGPRGGGRGGRGGGEDRPVRTDADGNPIQSANRQRRPEGQSESRRGDRQDKSGRGRRGDRKDGHGRGGAGTNQERSYKQKGQDAAEEEKVAEVKEPEPVVEMETIGVSIDDFLTGKTKTTKKEAREAEGVKGKTEVSTAEKVHQGTILKKGYALDHAKKADSSINKMFGFQATVDDDRDVPSRGGRGGRGGNRGGDRGGRGGGRQNAKHALRVTDDDFPTL